MLKSNNLSKQFKYISKYRKNAICLTLAKETKGINFYCKSKAIPLQAWTGPEGSRRVRLPDFRHMKVVRLSDTHTGCFTPKEIILVLISVRGCVAPGP